MIYSKLFRHGVAVAEAYAVENRIWGEGLNYLLRLKRGIWPLKGTIVPAIIAGGYVRGGT